MTMGNSAIVLYCKTKKRQWRGLDSCICSYCMCMLILQMSLTVPSRLVSNQMQKYKKSCTMRQDFVPKNATPSDEYKKKDSIKESLCSSLWWHCKTKKQQRIASMCGRVMFIHSQQGRVSTSRFTRRAPHLLSGSSQLITCLSKTFFFDRAVVD